VFLVKILKVEKNWFVMAFLSILLVSLSAPLFALPVSGSEDEQNDDVRIVPGTWCKLESDIVTVLFPADGKKPMFIWWYTKAPDQVYVVKFKGLIEWFAFDNPMLPGNPEYYNRLREAWQETWRERFENMYFKPEENRMGMSDATRLMLLHEIMYQMMIQMEARWHNAFLPFDVGRWTLSQPENITTPEGKVIGVSFGFTLTELPDWMPNLKFAENNIMIRVRFYNETVEETVPSTDFKYTVNAGEMKMDFVVNKWVWNMDTLKDLIERLQTNGFDIEIPEAKSRLALWVNLASINITRLPLEQAEEHPEEIEDYSTATHMRIEDHTEDVTENKTATEQETPIDVSRPVIKIKFANETTTLGGFFRFVSSAKTADYPNEGDLSMVPVKAAYISGGAHMRLFIGYPYFGNGTLEHDPSIGVDDVQGVDATPKYSVQTPSGMSLAPVVLGRYVMPLFTTEFVMVLIAVVSGTAIVLYVVKWKRKTPVNMVGVGTTG
jgi:hypothetical protein